MYIRAQGGHRRRTSPSTAPARALPDWSKLSRGDRVRVVRGDGADLSGVIDMLALDRSIFWVIQEGGRGRVMVCSADKPHVVVLSGGVRR